MVIWPKGQLRLWKWRVKVPKRPPNSAYMELSRLCPRRPSTFISKISVLYRHCGSSSFRLFEPPTFWFRDRTISQAVHINSLKLSSLINHRPLSTVFGSKFELSIFTFRNRSFSPMSHGPWQNSLKTRDLWKWTVLHDFKPAQWISPDRSLWLTYGDTAFV